jgi:glycerol-3-phosphate acyltransferase PlsY
MMLTYVLAGVLGYLLGAIPAAYLLRKRTSGSNITDEGSGNVGARNLYDVSGSLVLAIAAAAIDVGKGIAAVYVGRWLGDDTLMVTASAAVGAVLGHTYNLFLGGKGGRGLATAAGISAVLNPMLLVTWALMYLVGYYIIRRDIHIGSMTATIATMVLAMSFPEQALQLFTMVPIDDSANLRAIVVALCIPLFLRHVGPVRDVVRQMVAEDADAADD